MISSLVTDTLNAVVIDPMGDISLSCERVLVSRYDDQDACAKQIHHEFVAPLPLLDFRRNDVIAPLRHRHNPVTLPDLL